MRLSGGISQQRHIDLQSQTADGVFAAGGESATVVRVNAGYGA
jgi:hypothetical protein